MGSKSGRSNLRLRVVYDSRREENGIYVEFNPDDFKHILINEFNKTENVETAFDNTCKLLKQEILKM